MKILFNCLLGFIIILILDGRYLKAGTDPQELSNVENQFESDIQNEVNKDKSSLSSSNDIKITNNILKESKQEFLFPSQAVIDDSSFLNNVEFPSELTTSVEEVVFTSTDSGVSLKNKIKIHLENEKINDSIEVNNSYENERGDYIVQAEPKLPIAIVVEKTSEVEENVSEVVPISSQEEIKKTAPQHEDIPSFSEWTQKQLAEAEKKKPDHNNTYEKFTRLRGKFRKKNYASPDCGAKIVASNPESVSSSAVLSSLKDEYMLNYCTNRIWFVVELCEAIQAIHLDLANFELFSSSPKDFSVFISHRFPTREWSIVGKFTAQDSRDIQTFNLHPHHFGKYIKVEMHSHYGKEQFCPISWVGVYGTSEFEVLAKEDDRNLNIEEDEVDSFDEEFLMSHKRESPKNLFSSATDAVLSIVKKATAPFMKSEQNVSQAKNGAKIEESEKLLCISPRYIAVCNNCTHDFYNAVFQLLSCQSFSLNNLLSTYFVKRTLIHSENCNKYGLDFRNAREGAPFPSNFLKNSDQAIDYLTVMLKETTVAALCNTLAVSENKVVVNVTLESTQGLKNLTEKKNLCEEDPYINPDHQLNVNSEKSSLCVGECFQSIEPTTLHSSSTIFTEIFKLKNQMSKKIEPTKTLTEDEAKMLSSNFHSESLIIIAEEKSTDLTSIVQVIPTITMNLDREKNESKSFEKKETKVTFVETKGEEEKEIEIEKKSNNVTNQDSTLESIISDINAIEKAVTSPSNSFTPSSSNLPTESIFLRLANRIKNLEINMSLSSTYLEELSRRYRVQLELLSKTLNLTIQKIEEHSKIEEEKERRREKEMLLFRMQLANLTRDVSTLVREKNSWKPRASSISQHIFFISIEILLVWILFSYWKKPVESKNFLERTEGSKKINKRSNRRNSLEGVKGHEIPKRKKRRPSEEAMDIALSRNYKGDLVKLDKKRKKKKKESKASLNGIYNKIKSSNSELFEINSRHSSNIEKPNLISTSGESKSDTIPFNLLHPENIEIFNRFEPIADVKSTSENISRNTEVPMAASPTFMKTALAARNSRLKLSLGLSSSQEIKFEKNWLKKEAQKERKSSNSLKKYVKKFF